MQDKVRCNLVAAEFYFLLPVLLVLDIHKRLGPLLFKWKQSEGDV